jgi:ribosomal protein S18 acetylase RimI-like enzyme
VTIELRRLARVDVARLDRWLPVWNTAEYERRLAAQRRGDLVQVVAWAGDRPVGRGMLLFPGHDEYSVSAEREGCAEIRDVEVDVGHRRRGVGAALIGALEAAAVERRFDRIGLSVGRDDEYAGARSLYTKLGYRTAHGPFISGAVLAGTEGPIPVAGVLDYLVKTVRKQSLSP